MKVSLEWLNQYVDLQGLGVKELSHALTMVGFEVEKVETSGLVALEHVVVGEIKSFIQHPDADRLSVCQVDVGDGVDRTIVCGAKNFKANDRVLAALPGAVLPGDFKIKKSKLRGVVSEGMLCSERELGLGEDHGGIAILKDTPALGVPVNALFPEPDLVFDVEVTPNRPDALSHIGMARELAAWFKLDLKYPEIGTNFENIPSARLVQSVKCEAEQDCPHYRGYGIKGVEIKESPEWLKRRLKAIGLRPINNVVDATNYVLFETGQPLHAFDAAKIRGGQIVVRHARSGEKITTLDEKERKLIDTNLVIADAERALVIAGVIGSLDAEVDSGTKDIFLEAAYFNPVSIRRTSKQLGLSTDSSYRFERGIDPKGAEYAAMRCLDLILEVAGGELTGSPVVSGEAPLVNVEIEIKPNWIRERLGFEVSDEKISSHLSSLELDISETESEIGEPIFKVGIPSFRLDLYRSVDLVEEVIRLHGSDKIPQGEVRARVTLREDAPVPVYIRNASEVLCGKGFEEVLHYTLRNGEEIKNWFGHQQYDNLRIANPLASDASHLRASLIPGLLDCLRLNNARHNIVERLFETGRVFREKEEGRLVEEVSVGFVIQQLDSNRWENAASKNYYTVQAYILELFGKAGFSVESKDILPIVDENPWQAGHAGKVELLNGRVAAKFGLLSFEMLRQWDLEKPVLAGTLYFEPETFRTEIQRKSFKGISLYPPTMRDLAIVVNEKMTSGAVQRELAQIADGLVTPEIQLETIQPFDVYSGAGLLEGEKSIAYQLTFRSSDRTLNDKEVNQIFDGIVKAVDASETMRIRR